MDRRRHAAPDEQAVYLLTIGRPVDRPRRADLIEAFARLDRVGVSHQEIARRLRVSPRTVVRWAARGPNKEGT